MTQAILTNAAAISFDRDLTVATTTAANRELTYFRKGPIQSVAEVTINAMRRETYQGILGDLSSSILGPYNLQFMEETVGPAHVGTITVNVAAQTGSAISVVASENVTLKKGTLVRFANVPLTYVLTSDATITTTAGTLMLDQPVASSPAGSAVVSSGSGITFSMYLTQRPRASFGPTGIVVHDGPFRFVEVV